tara:strand:+ start:1056 stop:1298 length:243 start_codon:yes stop_codon:yes gene_type:complete
MSGRPHPWTEKDRHAFEVLKLLIHAHGFPPTIREFGEALGVVESVAWTRLHRLRDQGIITWQDGAARTIQVVKPGMRLPE